MRFTKLIEILFLIFILFVSSVHAQEADSVQIDGWWLNIGGGPELSTNTGIIDLGINLLFDFNQFSVQYTRTGNMFGESNSEYSLIYNYVFLSDMFFLSAGGGVSYVNHHYSEGLFSEEPKREKGGLGFPIRSQFFWRPLNFAGFGLIFHVNISEMKTVSGIIFSLQLGDLY